MVAMVGIKGGHGRCPLPLQREQTKDSRPLTSYQEATRSWPVGLRSEHVTRNQTPRDTAREAKLVARKETGLASW